MYCGYSQKSFNNKLTLGNLDYQMFPDLCMGNILLISTIVTFTYAVLVIYLWPLIIETDPENPAAWYYPVLPSYWKRGGE